MLWFYSSDNPVRSCQAWSVYLTTLLLGRLSPLSDCALFFSWHWQLPFFESAEGREWPLKIFHDQFPCINPESAKHNCSRWYSILFINFQSKSDMAFQRNPLLGRWFTRNVKPKFLWKIKSQTIVCLVVNRSLRIKLHYIYQVINFNMFLIFSWKKDSILFESSPFMLHVGPIFRKMK